MRIHTLRYLPILLLAGCGDSDDSSSRQLAQNVCAQADSNTLACDGGYSWWNTPLIATQTDRKSQIAFTGVSVIGDRSQQWVTWFDAETQQHHTHIFDRWFRGDEHNAPAVTFHQGEWLVAVMGHNELGNSRGSGVWLYRFSTDFVQKQVESFEVDAPVSYSQLLTSKDKAYLAFRHRFNGWGIVDIEEGTYKDIGASALEYPLFGVTDDGITTLSSYHPKANTQQLSLSNLILENSALSEQVQTITGSAETLRLLNRKVVDTKECAIYAEINPDNSWALYSVNIESTTLTDSNYLGTYTGMLDDYSTSGFSDQYILGADLLTCETAIVSAKSDNEYQLLEVDIDGNQRIILSSTKALYRPVIADGWLMYNEANYWLDYTDYRTTQHIIKL